MRTHGNPRPAVRPARRHWIAPVVVSAGRVVGTWDRDGTSVDVQLFDDDTAPSKRALATAIARMRNLFEILDAG